MNEAKTYKLVDLAKMMDNAHTLYHKALLANMGKEGLWQEVENEYASMFTFVQTYIPLLEAEFITQNSKIKRENNDLQGQLIALQRKFEQCSQRENKASQENPRLQEKNDHLQRENNRLKAQSETLTQENGHLKEENERLEMQVKRQTQDLAQNKAQLQDAQNSLREVEAAYQDCDQMQGACYTNNQELKRQLQQCKQEGTIEQQEPQPISINSEILSANGDGQTQFQSTIRGPRGQRPRGQRPRSNLQGAYAQTLGDVENND